MVGAFDFLGVPASASLQLRTAVRTTVKENTDLIVIAVNNQDWRFANLQSLEIAFFWNLRDVRERMPIWSIEDACELGLIHVFAVKDVFRQNVICRRPSYRVHRDIAG